MNFRLILIFFVLCFCSLSFASSSWYHKNKEYKLQKHPDGGYVNPSCLEKKSSCLAAKFQKEAVTFKKSHKGSPNPMSVSCLSDFSGKLVTVKKGTKEVTLCLFQDFSYLSLSAMEKK